MSRHPIKRRILEVGCGDHPVIYKPRRVSLENGTHYLGIDDPANAGSIKFGPFWSEPEIQRVRQTLNSAEKFRKLHATPHIDFKEMNGYKLPARWKNRFDVVFANNFFNSGIYASHFVGKIHSVVKPGGFLVIGSTYSSVAHTDGTAEIEAHGGFKEVELGQPSLPHEVKKWLESEIIRKHAVVYQKIKQNKK